MKLNTLFITQLSTISFIILLPSLVTSQTCKNYCGTQSLKYPFGASPGCGDPRFQTRVSCSDQQQLTFITHTGCYPITSIDYSNQIIFINDPSMSTCSCTQPSKGFSLDYDAPFNFHDNTVFALLDCSTTSSSIYKSNGGNNSVSPVCDSQGSESVCNLLSSCQAISNRVSIPISTCCVYTPVDLGPAFEMDLQKLGCNSYSGLYGFIGNENNPQSWKYGIALKYKFNFDNDYPEMCADCEKSNGVCGYNGPYNSFVCNCPNGLNTTANCFFPSYWSKSSRLQPWRASLIGMLAWISTWFWCRLWDHWQ